MQGKVRVGRRCGELKVCWGPTPQHISLHLPHSPPHILSPHANTLSHSPHTLSHTLPTLFHSPHIFPYLPPHPNTFPYFSSHSSPDLSLHPNTLSYSPHALSHTSPHILPHSFDYVAKLPCDDVTLNEFNSKAPLTSLYTPFTPCTLPTSYPTVSIMWRSYHVTMLP